MNTISNLVGSIKVSIALTAMLMPEEVRKGTMGEILEQVWANASYDVPGCEFLECIEIYHDDHIELNFYFIK